MFPCKRRRECRGREVGRRRGCGKRGYQGYRGDGYYGGSGGGGENPARVIIFIVVVTLGFLACAIYACIKVDGKETKMSHLLFHRIWKKLSVILYILRFLRREILIAIK